MNMIPSIPPPVQNPIEWELLEAVAATDSMNYADLVVRGPYETDRNFAAHYAFAA